MAALLYSADVVWPLAAPPLRAGGVLVEGDRITAVGSAARLRPAARRELRVSGVLLPGFVDAATCAERADEPLAGDPSTWTDERWQRSARHGVHQLVRAGVAAAADRVLRGPAVPAAGRAGLLGDALVAVADDRSGPHPRDDDRSGAHPRDGDRSGAHPRDDDRRGGDPSPGPPAEDSALVTAVRAALGRSGYGRRIGVAVSAHADDALLRSLAALTTAHGAPLQLDDAGGSIPRLADLGVLGPSTRLTGLSADDEPHLAVLARAGTAVVLRPRVEAAVPALDALDGAGVLVALGSGGAVPDPLADVAALAAADRCDPQRLLALATAAGAAAVGWSDAGRLAAGARADLVAVTLDGAALRADDRVLPAALAEALVSHGAGGQHLTVLAGVRRARREPSEPWPTFDDHTLPAPGPDPRAPQHPVPAAQGAR